MGTVNVKCGQLVATQGAVMQIEAEDVAKALIRHQSGDWGDVCPEDWAANDGALATGGRLLSSYRTAGGTKFWIITEADRSSTTVLLPEEY